jgi:FkbM family methyltransferase
MLEHVSAEVRRALGRASRTLPPFRGKGRVLRATDDVLRRHSGEGRLIEQMGGVRYALDTRDVIDFNLLYVGRHDAAIAQLLEQRISPGAVFWDVGANVGAISLPTSAAKPSVLIESFEPSPSVRARLLSNLDLNPSLASRIEVRPWALSNWSGETDFFPSGESGNSGIGGLTASGNRQHAPVRVRVCRADDLIDANEVPAPNFIKIDVEGHELDVLQGMERFLSHVPQLEIVFEHELYWFEQRRLPQDAVAKFLRGLGFELQRVVSENGSGSLLRPLRDADLSLRGDIHARVDRR